MGLLELYSPMPQRTLHKDRTGGDLFLFTHLKVHGVSFYLFTITRASLHHAFTDPRELSQLKRSLPRRPFQRSIAEPAKVQWGARDAND